MTANWYDTPLYYDIVFQQDTRREADFLSAMMRRHGPAGKDGSPPWHIIEPACGSGRLVAELAARGHQVHGFDINTRMLDYARERTAGTAAHKRISLWEDHMESFRPRGRRRYHLAHCLVSTFKYVLHESEAVAHLQRAAASLRPGGLYVLGLHLTDYRQDQPLHERWVGRRGPTEVVCNTRTWPARRRQRLERLRTRLRITKDGVTTSQETLWEFRTYNAAQLKSMLAKVDAFECVACHDFTYDPDVQRSLDDSYADIILVLRRRGNPSSQPGRIARKELYYSKT